MRDLTKRAPRTIVAAGRRSPTTRRVRVRLPRHADAPRCRDCGATGTTLIALDGAESLCVHCLGVALGERADEIAALIRGGCRHPSARSAEIQAIHREIEELRALDLEPARDEHQTAERI